MLAKILFCPIEVGFSKKCCSQSEAKMWILLEVIYYECTSSQLSMSVITFGWVCCCTRPKVMTDMLN